MGLEHGACAALLIGCALVLSGCSPDVYEETCVWHSDLNIKGCDFYGFKSCVHHCTYCVTESGPDECGQLKCAAYCAQRNGDDDCRTNFKTLCDIAMQEQTDLSSCNVDCSVAGRSAPRSLGLLLLLSLTHIFLSDCISQSLRSAKRLMLLCALAAIGFTLHGCCEDPEHQLPDWDPDFEEFKTKADWYDENGIWRGNPTWRFTPEHEAEGYVCKTMHETRPICVVWTSNEWNCNEQDFGICKCHSLPSESEGNYCQAWGCHSLEADQEVCHLDSEGNVACSYEEFKMDEDKYYRLVSMQESGVLTTGENIWWSFSSAWNAGNNRLLSDDGNSTEGPLQAVVEGSAEMSRAAEADTEGSHGTLRSRLSSASSSSEAVGQPAPARQLQADAWPPAVAYNPAMRWRYFSWGDVCIANGDNVALVKVKCNRWREVETEISQCFCKKGSSFACTEWSCEERDVGLFSVLFRTKQPIDQYTVGTEKEEYTCKKFDDGVGSKCVAWEGDISSVEEAEWTRCECADGYSCHGVGAVWKCDEYELPRTRDLFWHENRAKWTPFILIEIAMLVLLCQGFVGGGDAIGVAVCMGSCVGVILFPFLLVTLGFYAFLLIGLPFWAIRCTCLGCACCAAACGRGDGEEMRGTGSFKRGLSAIIGRQS